MNVGLLLIFFLCTMYGNLTGVDMISCTTISQDRFPRNFVDQYCLNEGANIVIPKSTYYRRPPTEEEVEYLKRMNHNGIAAPGIMSHYTANTRIKSIVYYRWIPLFFLLQVEAYAQF